MYVCSMYACCCSWMLEFPSGPIKYLSIYLIHGCLDFPAVYSTTKDVITILKICFFIHQYKLLMDEI